MGTLASLTNWIPEDDLLLKNAVEAGASLESLAKGAVCFSRRFTLKELQDRWRALLYDVDTSQKASARIIDIEIELSVSNPSKPTRTCSVKGKDGSYGKRKMDSVRSHYYAMRKRVCTEPRSSPDLAYPKQPGSLCVDADNARGNHLNSHAVCPDDYCISADKCAQEAPLLSHYGHLETNYGNGQHFPSDRLRLDASNAGGVSAHAFTADHAEDELCDGTMEHDCLHRYANNALPSIDKTGGDNTDQAVAHDFGQEEVCQVLGENLLPLKSCSNVNEVESPQALHMNNLYEDVHVEAKPIHNFDSTNDNRESLCSGFVAERNISSQVPDCANSVHQLGYSSSPSGLPLWREIDDVSTPTMPIDGHFVVQDQGISAPVMDTIGAVKKMASPGYDDVTSDPKAVDEIPDLGFDHSAIISDGDFYFSSALMNFPDDDFLFANEDEEGTGDRTCLNGLNSLMLSSACETHQDNAPSSSEPRETTALETCLMTPDGACSPESDNLNNQVYSVHDDERSGCIPEVNMPSTSSNVSHNTEPSERFMICILNTEDPDIPCNDDVFPSAQFSPCIPSADLECISTPMTRSIYASSKVLFADGKTAVEGLSMAKEEQLVTVQPLISSLKPGLSLLPDVGSMHSPDRCRLEAESFEKDSIAGVARNAAVASDDPKSRTSASITVCSAPVSGLMQESSALEGKHGHFNSSIETPIQGSNPAKLYPQVIDDVRKLEVDLQVIPHKFAPLGAAGVALSGPITTTSNSDHEELLSESENDIPNFSDVESMILDMDLGPHDQESYLLCREVSRYQCLDTKRAIVRLEQGAHASMRRTMSAHGAFAIFYGHRLKYFIKSSKVLLGRATEDVSVDIDLRREGRANKVSRRQAIIKMDEDGLFCLKNIGKCSIFVDSTEVLAKKHINLSSGCLVEIRNMRFIFEINQNAVQRYITSLQGSSQEPNARFEWIPDQIQ